MRTAFRSHRRYERLAAAVPVLGIMLCCSACGASASPQGDGRAGCEIQETGEVIVLKNSGLSCANARAIVYLLAADLSRPQVVKTPDGTWRCSEDEKSVIAGDVICRQGKREFVVHTTAD